MRGTFTVMIALTRYECKKSLEVAFLKVEARFSRCTDTLLETGLNFFPT